jgi:hypothetical protein
MRYISLRIACILILLLVPLIALGALVGAAEDGATTGFIVRQAANLAAIAGVILTLMMRRAGVYIFVVAMFGGTVLNLLFATPEESARIAEVGIAPLLAVGLVFVGLIVGVFLACVLPHWKNLK